MWTTPNQSGNRTNESASSSVRSSHLSTRRLDSSISPAPRNLSTSSLRFDLGNSTLSARRDAVENALADDEFSNSVVAHLTSSSEESSIDSVRVVLDTLEEDEWKYLKQ